MPKRKTWPIIFIACTDVTDHYLNNFGTGNHGISLEPEFSAFVITFCAKNFMNTAY
jgi:hypothetical protein